MARITRRRALTTLAVRPSLGSAAIVPVQAHPEQTKVNALFTEWLDAANAAELEPEEDEKWGESRYVRLQTAILAAEPESPRDVAIQFFVDCDRFGSDFSEHFKALVTRLIGPIN